MHKETNLVRRPRGRGGQDPPDTDFVFCFCLVRRALRCWCTRQPATLSVSHRSFWRRTKKRKIRSEGMKVCRGLAQSLPVLSCVAAPCSTSTRPCRGERAAFIRTLSSWKGEGFQPPTPCQEEKTVRRCIICLSVDYHKKERKKDLLLQDICLWIIFKKKIFFWGGG